MTKRSALPKSRRHVSLNDEDWDFLESLYGASSNAANPLGVGQAICQIVHAAVIQLRARYEARRDWSESTDWPKTVEGEIAMVEGTKK